MPKILGFFSHYNEKSLDQEKNVSEWKWTLVGPGVLPGC